MYAVRAFVLTMIVALLIASTHPSRAQDPGDAGVFADSLGTQTTRDVVVNEPFYVYVVAFDLPEVGAYEGRIQGVPPEMILLSGVFMGPAPLFLGSFPLNFIVSAGGCVTRDSRYVLYKVQFLATQLVPSDTAILFRASNPSSYGGMPGYTECDLETRHAFGVATQGESNYPDGALILNPSELPGPVGATTESFGHLKSRY